jgi:hypothetical protein
LIETGSRASVFGGYLFGSGLMVLAAIIEMIWASRPSANRLRRWPVPCRWRKIEAAISDISADQAPTAIIGCPL